ncbi:MAG: tRNA (cytidine/uridine-2-O-)-methyltransferase [Desulfonauticus sp.]|nr:MAG: tRNA (cytidine(34)-2'-O)-methyltransferase [Desulfonauticus sp. 38_4375]MDK2921173.1 tRNA (cytidine/uridine-2-O-)-methyltransferase [Desulfonauticus sp.]
MEIVLFEPEIPPNTGNIARLCAATTTPLHLIEPLGFKLEDKYLKRAGLDYWQYLNLRVWKSWSDFYQNQAPDKRLVFTSARQGEIYTEFSFTEKDVLVFGPESRGLPEYILAQSPFRIRIPLWGKVRSLNLSTAAGIVLYEAYRQIGVLKEG